MTISVSSIDFSSLFTASMILNGIGGIVMILGFSLLFQVPRKYIPLVLFGGVVAWFIYYINLHVGGSRLAAALLGSTVCTLIAAALETRTDQPLVVFLTPMAVPMMPSRVLLDTCNSILDHDWSGFVSNGDKTLQSMLGIGLGVVVASTIADAWYRKIARRASKQVKKEKKAEAKAKTMQKAEDSEER